VTSCQIKNTIYEQAIVGFCRVLRCSGFDSHNTHLNIYKFRLGLAKSWNSLEKRSRRL